MSKNSRIKELRQKQNLSQAALGDLIGTTSQNVGLLERGERELNVRWMEKLADALDCDPSDFLPNTGLSETGSTFGSSQNKSKTTWKDSKEAFDKSLQIIMGQLNAADIVPTYENTSKLISMFLEQIESFEQLMGDEAKIIAKTIVGIHSRTL